MEPVVVASANRFLLRPLPYRPEDGSSPGATTGKAILPRRHPPNAGFGAQARRLGSYWRRAQRAEVTILLITATRSLYPVTSCLRTSRTCVPYGTVRPAYIPPTMRQVVKHRVGAGSGECQCHVSAIECRWHSAVPSATSATPLWGPFTVAQWHDGWHSPTA